MDPYIILFFCVLVISILRICFVVFKILTTECKLVTLAPTLRTIVCIGSGGHTTEMLRLLPNLNMEKFVPRLYILAHSDMSSEVKIHKVENGTTYYVLNRIPRSRRVYQSYLSSVFSTLYATLYTIPVVVKFKPDVIICNGPGNCIPVCAVAFLLRCFFLINCRIIFIESLCRVRTLSLSGRILQYFADIFIVQWPQLREICHRAKYFGRLT